MQDNDYNYRHDQNVLTSNALRKEMEDLRFLLNEKNRGNNELQAEIGAVRDQISRREQECVALQREVAVKGDQAYALRKDADNLAFELGRLREEKAKDQDEINRMRDGVAFKERECQDNDARIKAVDYDLFKAQERANELSKLADSKEFELRRTCEALDSASGEMARTKDDHSRLNAEVTALQRNLDGQLAHKGDLARNAENEDARARDMNAQAFERENRLRAADDQMNVGRKEQDNMRFNNNNLLERNNDVKSEIGALNQHCHVLQGQNKDLNVELERFVMTDEQIRATLNRRDRVAEMRHVAEFEAARTHADVVRSTSPHRVRRF
jgi:chromosome segregation ATPase